METTESSYSVTSDMASQEGRTVPVGVRRQELRSGSPSSITPQDAKNGFTRFTYSCIFAAPTFR